MTDPIRLSKHLAALLPCSRREAELYIAGGWVRVDGVVVEEPQFRITDQKVELDLGAQAEPALPASMLWHKPAGIDAEIRDIVTKASDFATNDPLPDESELWTDILS